MSPEGRRARAWQGVRGYLFGEKRGYRDLWLFAASALLVLSLIVLARAVNEAKDAASHAKTAVHEVQEGRKAATGFTCAASSALAQAGREIVEQGTPGAPTPRAEQLLMELGYPPLDQRAAAAKATGRAYVKRITVLVEQKAHIPKGEAKEIVQTDGSLNCNRLRVLVKAK